jgi:hypothetical protein
VDTRGLRGGEVCCFGGDLFNVTDENGRKTVYIYPRMECRQSLSNRMGEASGQAKERASQSREVEAHASRRTRSLA